MAGIKARYLHVVFITQQFSAGRMVLSWSLALLQISGGWSRSLLPESAWSIQYVDIIQYAYPLAQYRSVAGGHFFPEATLVMLLLLPAFELSLLSPHLTPSPGGVRAFDCNKSAFLEPPLPRSPCHLFQWRCKSWPCMPPRSAPVLWLA